MKNHTKSLMERVSQLILDKKGFNILCLDVSEFSSLTDVVIIAEGNIEKHIIAISGEIQKELKKIGIHALAVEGMQVGDWVVLDYGHVMVHLFAPGMREIYRLEQLWPSAKVIDVSLVIK